MEKGLPMSLPPLLGPVLAYEWRISSRRWQTYALRSAFVALLGVVLAVVWMHQVSGRVQTLRALADTGEFFFCALVGTQLAVVLVVAPAATAGTLGTDRARAELMQLLATDLSSREIIL